MRTLCLGEALVDLVCHEPVASLADAPAFVPHVGGAVANVAAGAARLGAHVALAGGVGDDQLGRLVRDRLAAAGVDLAHFALVPGVRTPVALVALDPDAVPTFAIYGEAIEAAIGAVADGLPAAVDAADALFLSSNTLVGEREREVTLAARDRAAAAGKPVVFDPNLRLDRWKLASNAVEEALDVARGAFLVKCNAEEARLLTGERDLEAAARSLLAAGARHVVITLGPDGALLRGGPRSLDVPGVPASPVDTTGAGDAVTGVLLGRLALSGFYPPALAAALPEAVAHAASVTERWGALG